MQSGFKSALLAICFIIIYAETQACFAKIDSADIAQYFAYTQTLEVNEAHKALKKAKRLFRKGRFVDTTLLQSFHTACSPLVQMSLKEEELTGYCLFNGTNFIVGQTVVLYLDERQKVRLIEIRSFGR